MLDKVRKIETRYTDDGNEVTKTVTVYTENLSMFNGDDFDRLPKVGEQIEVRLVPQKANTPVAVPNPPKEKNPNQTFSTAFAKKLFEGNSFFGGTEGESDPRRKE